MAKFILPTEEVDSKVAEENKAELIKLAVKHPRAKFSVRANRLIRESGVNKGNVFGIFGVDVPRYIEKAPDGDKREFASLLGVPEGYEKPSTNRFDAALLADAKAIEAARQPAAPVASPAAPADAGKK